MSIEWTRALATGVTVVDEQHKEIFKRVNRLSEACSAGKGREEVLNLLLFLGDYVKEHFAAEEKLQVRYGYPGYAQHKSQHTRFIADISRLATAFKTEGATLSLVIMTNKTLTAWLVQHISKTDMELADFLKEQDTF
jgi:hemerythrin